MKKTLLAALTLILAIGAVTVVFAAPGSDQSSPTVTRAASDDTRKVDDNRHAGDHRRAEDNRRADDDGVADDRMRGARDDADEPGEVEVGEDIPGPCDEAEHATDPRCTGVAAPQADDEVIEPADDDDAVDNSGPGSLNSGPGGLSSGPSASVDDDGGEGGNSGPGGGESGGSH
jgi:hypothetical protein